MTSAGRVQTPTLAILSERERAIRDFVPRDYWEVHAEFEVYAGRYEGRWFREEFSKPEGDDQARAERIWSEAEASAVVERCTGQTGIVEETKKPSKQAPPQLYDLTTLQREASSRFGLVLSPPALLRNGLIPPKALARVLLISTNRKIGP